MNTHAFAVVLPHHMLGGWSVACYPTAALDVNAHQQTVHVSSAFVPCHGLQGKETIAPDLQHDKMTAHKLPQHTNHDPLDGDN